MERMLHQRHGKPELPAEFRDAEGLKLTAQHVYDEVVFRAYRKTQLEPEVLVCGFALFQKLCERHKVTRHTLKRSLVTCLMIESKINDDRSMKLQSFARQMDIPESALLQTELFVCTLLDWHVCVSDAEYRDVYARIERARSAGC